MSLQSAPQFAFEFGGGRPIEVEISKAPLSSDAGLLVFRQLDERLRYTEQFAAAMRDTRVDPKQDLASQPTLSRFEKSVSIGDLWRLRSVFVDVFLQSFAEPPASAGRAKEANE